MWFLWSCSIHLGHWHTPAVSVCAVCLLAVQNSAVWQGNHILTGWGRCPVAAWENMRQCQEASQLFERGSLLQNYQSEPVVSPSILNVLKGNRLQPSPAVLARQREREKWCFLLLQKGSESAGPWFPSNSNYCLCFWDCLIQRPPF